jgi:hypothetical protein
MGMTTVSEETRREMDHGKATFTFLLAIKKKINIKKLINICSCIYSSTEKIP